MLFPDDKVMRRRLKNQCREVKEKIMGIGSDLSIDVMTQPNVDLRLMIQMTFNVDGIEYPLEYKINRAKFNALCEPSFGCTMAIIDDALRNAKMSKDQIDDIVNQNVFFPG